MEERKKLMVIIAILGSSKKEASSSIGIHYNTLRNYLRGGTVKKFVTDKINKFIDSTGVKFSSDAILLNGSRLYKKRNINELGRLYNDHMRAIDVEQLCDRSNIAAELAYRDKKIEEFEMYLDKEGLVQASTA